MNDREHIPFTERPDEHVEPLDVATRRMAEGKIIEENDGEEEV